MAFDFSDNNGKETIRERRSRFEDPGTGRTLQVRGTESSMLSVKKELEDIRLDPLPLDSRLKKTGLSGYRRSSVEAYVDEMKRSANQLKDSMEQQIQSLSAECMRLKSESQVLRGQLVQAEEQTNQVRDRLAAVTNERDAAEKEISRAAAELESMEQRVSLYESENTQIADLEEQLREKTEELACAAAENESLNAQLKDFSEEVSRIYEEFLEYKEKKEAEGGEIARLEQEAAALREDNEELRAELDAAKRESGGSAGEEYRLEQDALREENASLMERYSKLFAEYKKEQNRGNGLAQENESLSGELEECLKKVRETEKLRKIDQEQRTAIDELKKMINSLLDEAQHQQETIDSLSVGQSRKDQEQRAAIEELQRVIARLQDEAQHQQETIDSLMAERSESKELIYSLTHDRSDLHVQNVDLQVQNVDLLDKNEELSKRVAALEEENARLGTQLRQKPPAAIIPMPQSEQADSTDGVPGERFSESVKKVRTISSY